jgi:hypothetical protein
MVGLCADGRGYLYTVALQARFVGAEESELAPDYELGTRVMFQIPGAPPLRGTVTRINIERWYVP